MQVTDCRPKHLRESLSYGSFWMAQRLRKERVMKDADMRATNKSEPQESLEGCFVQMRQ
jgi:hypothetical protein